MPPPVVKRVPESVFAKVKVPEELVMVFPNVRPLKETAVVVASVIAPVCVVPKDWATERTPVLVIDGATEPTTVKEVHATPEVQDAVEVETLKSAPEPLP